MLSGPFQGDTIHIGTSVIFLILPDQHSRPPLSCHIQFNRLEGDLSMATIHVQL